MVPATLKALVNAAEPVESITTMEAAAQSRLLDAVAISVERPAEALGCAYLLGYVVECTLKAALGRIVRLLPAADVYAGVVVTLPVSQRHDPTALLQACFNARLAHLSALSAADESVWRTRVDSVTAAVDVRFRYKSYVVLTVALAPLYDDVEWIVAHAAELWT